MHISDWLIYVSWLQVEEAGQRVAGQVMLGRQDQPALFVLIDGGQGATVTAVAAPADLCEYQGVTVLHDQVDLALSTAEVTGYDSQSLLR